MRLNAKQIANYTGGAFAVDPIDASEILNALTWDSRDVQPGCLYVALPGERVDGHDFVDAALRGGARAALIMQPPAETTKALAREMGAALIEVPNTTAAITDLAREWRGHLRGTVVGITGSTGKTTTKNLVRSVLAAHGSVVATVGNQNNELGVPKTLLSADPDTRYVVVEMGMRGVGQITQLCDFVRPHWGLVANVGESHIELLGGKRNIARAKAELLGALPKASGVAFVNDADDMADFLLSCADLERWDNLVVRFNGSGSVQGGQPAVWASDVALDEQGCAHFTLCACGFADGEEGTLRQSCVLGLRGLHNVSNAVSAAAVGLAAGMDLAVIAQALGSALPEAGRQEVIESRHGFMVVNDAYNANPDSMRASLATFCALEVPGARIAVLGDMGELGDFAQACHEGIGKAAAALPLDKLVCVGELAQFIADAAVRAGMPAETVVRAHSVAEVLGELDGSVRPGDAVLVKASHFMELTRVVEGLVN